MNQKEKVLFQHYSLNLVTFLKLNIKLLQYCNTTKSKSLMFSQYKNRKMALFDTIFRKC